jgi:hypothetical protein
MNRTRIKQAGAVAGYFIVPLAIASVIGLIALNGLQPIVIAFLIALAVCLAIYTATNPDAVGRFFTTQAVRNTVTTLIIAVSVIGIVVLVNILATRLTVRIDTTKNQAFSLSDSTIKAIQQVKEPVKINIFYNQSTTSQHDQAADLANEYKARNDKISYQSFNVDTLEGFGKARELGVNTNPSIILEQGTKRETASTLDEQGLTRAIVRIGKGVQRRVLFVQGHGERGLTFNSDPNSSEGMSEANTALTNNNYKVASINLLTRTTGDNKPAELNPATDILIFAGPGAPMRPDEIQYVVTFLKQGGRALFMYDPVNLILKQDTKTNLNDILKEWADGPKFQEGRVLETNPGYVLPQSPTLLIPRVEGGSSITRGIGSNDPVLYAFSSSIEKGTNETGFVSLLTTSPDSYLKTDVKQITGNQVAFDNQKDKRGPLVVAASFETDPKETPPATTTGTTPTPAPTTSGKTRMVLFAGVTFATDNTQVGLTGQAGNFNLFVNAVNWLAEEEDAVVVENRQQESTPFTISKSQDTFIYYSAVFGLPILVFFLGLVIWWRRR